MGNLASGHFKPTNKIQAEHNDRTLSPSYLLPKEFRGQNEVNRHSKQAMILKNQIIENAHETYLITFKQKSQAKSYQWSLVVNTKETTTMSDLEKLAEHFEIKYGFQCYQIAIHRDEGYMDENNQPHINHHAHMEFITLNKENGKNMWGQINKVKLRQIQTEIAQILGMERGTDKRVSGIERIEPRKYAQMKNKERKERSKDAKLIDELTSSMSELNTHATTLKQGIEAKNQKIDELQERPTTERYSQLERTNSEQAQTIKDKDKEIATLNTLNAKLEKTNKDLLNITEQYLLLDLIYDNPTDEKTEKKAEDYKHLRVFTKLWNAIKELFSLRKLVASIKKILFGDENAKKDPQEIEQKIKELSERPTKSDFEYRKKCHKEAVKHYQEAEKIVFNGKKNSWLLVTDYDAKKLNERLTELKEKESKLNTLESADLAIELEKSQDRVKTLESNETALIKALYDKESIIQSKGRTINRLKKELKELEYNYRQERERMQAENKHLKDQGLEKIYTQKDYEDLKKAHHQEVEALKKEIQEYKTQETYTPTKRM
ncbi:hypothetical protein [Helicobacter pylori]|uniref:hypothetical protein n=1 Tax=Helicobacter pylori TaxID=210 RepID=UPI00217D6C1D|nr:hypothetical protein [Helicobacter pylori]